ncbi:Nucleoporin [Lachnellula suecica]|uniref:Nucleoporin n=1 Tax=Lachnellula suecica TaxID=602035 RepID=A0A8T9CF48_9HELO|nr:Nucleoporin [Lachnellula suecica]
MATTDPSYTYKETRLDLDSSTQGSTVVIRLPSPGGASRVNHSRSQILELPVAEDARTFKHRHIATAASIYHRGHHKSPRSFLWRVLEDAKVLSIRAVDVSTQPKVAEANLTLRLTFPSPIVPTCIAVSDSEAHDVLSVFVVTESKHLYTLSLRPEYFRRASSTEDNVGDWCESYSLPSIKSSHRLVALTADAVLLSLTDGGLLRLERKSGGDGTEWDSRHIHEGGWGSLRNMISLRASNSLDLLTATSISSPATTLGGKQYGFTVTLDHRLRIWNLSDFKLACSGDLLNQDLDEPETTKQVIESTNSQLVKVYSRQDDTALCVTYSPLLSGQFKFWHVSVAANGKLELTDLFPSNVLQPPATGTWVLADFSVTLDAFEANNFTLWTLWKLNKSFQVRKLKFQTASPNGVKHAWNRDWEAMAGEARLLMVDREDEKPKVCPGESTDLTEQWLNFILFPGKFTNATIETCLAATIDNMPTDTLRQFKEATRGKSATLPERICAAIASTVSLGRTSDGMDYQRFNVDTNKMWHAFHQYLTELDDERGEALSMVIDPQGDMPWIILADGISAVRECSSLERIWHDQETRQFSRDDEPIATPLLAASEFRKASSDEFRISCKNMLLGEIFEEPSFPDPVRMRDFYEKCDFSNNVDDGDYTKLLGNLGGSFDNITPYICDDILRRMNPARSNEKRPQDLPLAEFGNKLVLKGVQTTVELHREICLDLLVLLVLIEVEIFQNNEGTKFETAAFFHRLVLMLQRLELLNWLASTQISLPLENTGRSNSITDKSLKKQTPAVETVTVLEGVLRHLFGLDLKQGEAMPAAVTEVILSICAPDSEYEATPAVIQCFLLKQGRPDLAMDFSRFTEQDVFSTYIQGRTHLAANDPGTAASLFKKAAFGIDPQKRRHDYRSAGYLDDTERNSFNAGLPEYYAHIVSLYDQQKAFSFVIDFARLSLQFIKPGSENPQHSPLRTEMHSRLFSSAIQTARFDLASSTLTLFTDSALQHSSLRTLINRMCETSYAAQLIELPFIGLQDAVDEILAQKCQSIVDVNVGVPYHKILYAWRVKRGDFRGAASTSLQRLQRLQQSGDGDRALGDDGLETPVTKQYIALINALSCVDPQQAWILYDELPTKSSVPSKKGTQLKRKVVTLEDIRKEYTLELDRIAAIDNNQFAFTDEMDVL